MSADGLQAAPKPRVLFVSPVSDIKGGAEIVLCNMLANPYLEPVLAVPEEGALADAARARGAEVDAYHPGALLAVHRPPRLLPILAAAWDVVACARRIQRMAQLHHCDVIHSNGLKAHVICAVLGLATRSRTLVHLHDIAYSRAERIIWRSIARCVHQVVLVSRPCFPGDELPANVCVVPNGITPAFAALSAQLPQAGPLRLGFVGRFHPNKGLDLLLDWFACVRRAGIDATLTIRGRPDPDMPEYWQRILQRLADEDLAPHTRLDGWVTGAATYAGLDILLVPSKVPDPGPLVIFEAMTAGLIVAGYPAGGILYAIEDGINGLLVTDGEELVGKLRPLLEDPTQVEEMRRVAHARILADFSMAGFHRAFAELYARMMSR